MSREKLDNRRKGRVIRAVLDNMKDTVDYLVDTAHITEDTGAEDRAVLCTDRAGSKDFESV